MPTRRGTRTKKSSNQRKVRYAVIGMGYISQIAILPAFAHASENSELVALVSDDETKLRKLAKKYKVANTYTYESMRTALRAEMSMPRISLFPIKCIAPTPKPQLEQASIYCARSRWRRRRRTARR